LKRKKERRKVRNTTTAVAGTASPPTLDKDDEDGDEWEDENVDDKKPAKTPAQRPKKKRKLDLDGPDSDNAAPMAVDVDRSSTPSLVGALPSFPLPKHPDAPSKTDLALQGLDKSLVDAEVVWDGETQNLNDIGPRMSERMKKRLKELGIAELFAGLFFGFSLLVSGLTYISIVQKVLLPVLLPSETSLYTPYDPPPDVCVSAPTGSGKTLAYSVPVIEVVTISPCMSTLY
jgi:ATP-dependent RNA helicase DDX51/DBP6